MVNQQEQAKQDKAEVQKRVADLEAAIREAGNPTPEVTEALAALKAEIQA
jgi:hypothetical protein